MQLFLLVVFCVFSPEGFAVPDNPNVTPPPPPSQSAAEKPSTGKDTDTGEPFSPTEKVSDTGEPSSPTERVSDTEEQPPSSTERVSDTGEQPPSSTERVSDIEEQTSPDKPGETEQSLFLFNDISGNTVYLDDMSIGQAILNNKPQAYKKALRELIGWDISLEDLLQFKTKEGKQILDLMIWTKSEYFTKEMERILHLTLLNGMFDIPLELQNYERFVDKRPFKISFDSVTVEFSGQKLSKVHLDTSSPRLSKRRGTFIESHEESPLGNIVHVTSLIETASQLKNEEAVSALKSFQQLVKKIQLEYIGAQQMALDILKRSNRSSKWITGITRFASGAAVAALGGLLILEGVDVTFDASTRAAYKALLDSIIDHLSRPEILIASGVGVTTLGILGVASGSNICSRAFRKKREISRQKRSLNQRENHLQNL